MRVVLQRVREASVSVDGRTVGAIQRGLLLLVGFRDGDGDAQIGWMAEKIRNLRIFPDNDDKMNRSVADVDGAVLAVSQFTLYADVDKGRRPSFVTAAPSDIAEPLFVSFVEALRARGVPVETGAFGAMMAVSLVNDGPVTMVLDR